MTRLSPARRSEIINRCVVDEASSIMQDESETVLEDLLRSGFLGFDKMTDEELLQAYRDASLDEAYAEEDEQASRRNPHMPRHPRPRGPRGGTSEAQSILVPAEEFTPAQAKAWVKRHGFKVSGYDAPDGRGAYHRFRQFDPDHRHSYRTIPFGDSGVMAVIEVPKRK